MCIRDRDVSKAYFQCHTDITIPYKELAEISAVKANGEKIMIIQDGHFVLPGTEELNEPLKELEESVSYTHLDVYKRQDIPSGRI